MYFSIHKSPLPFVQCFQMHIKATLDRPNDLHYVHAHLNLLKQSSTFLNTFPDLAPIASWLSDYKDQSRKSFLPLDFFLKKTRVSTISDITFLQFTVFLWKVNSSQVKWNLNSTITNFLYLLPHELPNNSRLT